jgi:2',3'-cyclic-nucleotide 2'-phosphodiesterase/3'-nucleotidase
MRLTLTRGKNRPRVRSAIGRLAALGALGAPGAVGMTACSSDGVDSVGTPPPLAHGTTATLALLETTDIHTNLLSYDYYKLAEDKSLGLERTATLLAAARKEFPNTMLRDDGDTIQGTALADYQAQVAPIDCKTTLSVYKVMNLLKYDAGTIGNHEFN